MTTSTLRQTARKAERALAPIVKAEVKIDRAAGYQDEYIAGRLIAGLSWRQRKAWRLALEECGDRRWPARGESTGWIAIRLGIPRGWARRRLVTLAEHGLVEEVTPERWRRTPLGDAVLRRLGGEAA